MRNHNHDLIHHLSETLDGLWRYDQYIQNAQGCAQCIALWNEMKKRDGEIEKILLDEIKNHAQAGALD